MLKFLYFLILIKVYFVRTDNPSVIIIGAGPAGIAAATRLLENSFENIKILEAENRIGGRINSVDFGDTFADVGAEYCHGENGNVVYELVKDLNLLEHSSSADNIQLYYSNGSKIDTNLSRDLQTMILNYDSDTINNNPVGMSLKEAFLRTYNLTLLEKYVNDKDKVKIIKEGLEFAQNFLVLNEGAFSWEEPSARRHFRSCRGDHNMSWKRYGYRIILDVLMKKYPNKNEMLPIDDKIVLNKKIINITWNSKNRVIVKASDNTTFQANHIIFTPSVGVLKAQKNVLFHPQLPKWKNDAIQAIGFGGIMKIIMHFPNKWWRDDDKVFLFLWSEEDLKKSSEEFPHGPKKNRISWVSKITALLQITANPKALVALVSTDLVPEIEQLPLQTVEDGCMYVIRKFLNKNYNITAPRKIIKSEWCSNPNFQGTYSYERKEYFREDFSHHEQLSQPLINDEGKPIILFAGEATSPNHYSTVHGAIESGWREAERIINIYQK